MNKYFDIRQDFWKAEFEKALPYEAYLAAAEETHRAKWRDMARKIHLSAEQNNRVSRFTRKINVLCSSGCWCGDCVRQGPMLLRIAEATPLIRLRFAERVEGARLTDEIRINGAAKVPATVILSEDFFELGRFGDSFLTAYRRKARTQLGAACDTGLVAPPADEIQAEIAEWLDVFERMYLILRLSPMLRERYGD